MNADDLQRAVATTRAVLTGVRPPSFDNPTPCETWTVRDLIFQMIGAPTFTRVVMETGDWASYSYDPVDPEVDDVRARYHETTFRLVAAFRTDGGSAKITVNPEVQRPAEGIFAYATDPTRFHEWQKGVIGGHVDQPGTPAIGTRCVNTRRIGVANRPVTSEIAHTDPPRTWGVRGVDGPIRAVVDVAVEPLADSRSRLAITLDFEGHGIGKVLVPFVVIPQARKEMPANLAALRGRLETDPR